MPIFKAGNKADADNYRGIAPRVLAANFLRPDVPAGVCVCVCVCVCGYDSRDCLPEGKLSPALPKGEYL